MRNPAVLIALLSPVLLFAGEVPPNETARREPEVPKEKQKERPRRWSGALDVSAAVRRGNTDSSTVAVRLKAERKDKKTRLLVEGAYDYGEEGDVPNVKKGLLKSRLEWETPGRVFPWTEMKGEHDRYGGVQFRFTAAAGAGVEVIKEKDQTLSLRLGVAYIDENAIAPATDREVVGFTAALDWVARPRPDTAIEAKVEWQGESGPWRMRGEVTFRQNLSSWLSLRLSLVDTYDSAPPSGSTSNDMSVLLGLGVTF